VFFTRLVAFSAMTQRDLLRSRYFRLFLALFWLIEDFHVIYYCDRGNMDISEIAHVVKHHRKVAKLSQAELGRLAGVGKTAVFDLEHKKETIRFDVVRKILEALNITVKLGSPLFSLGDKADSPREKEET
jgi:HTH-type transcriptional regulator / antitoxin HipB